MKKLILITSILFVLKSFSQEVKRKFRPLLWTTHSKNTDILGISVGILPKETFKDSTLTKTFGARIEVPGFGLLLPLIPKNPISKTYQEFQKKLLERPTEIVYGINISSGSMPSTQVNGISSAFIGQYLIKENGISLSIIGNIIEQQNGIAMSFIGNNSYKTNGVMAGFAGNSAIYINGIQLGGFNNSKNLNGIQIGISNKVNNSKGIQIGLWNKNEKRSLPFINWNFKS